MRAGLADYAVAAVRVHGLAEFVDAGTKVASWSQLGTALVRDAALLGSVPLLATLAALVRSVREPDVRARMLLWPLAGVVLLWTLLLRQHVIVHDYQTVIAAPLAALSVAAVVPVLQRRSRGPRVAWGLALVTALVAAAVATPLDEHGAYETSMIAAGALIARHVPTGDIVLTPEDSMVLVYYAGRHVVRGVRGDADITRHADALAALCPTCGVVAAVPVDQPGDFAHTTAHATLLAHNDDFLLYRLPAWPARLAVPVP